MSNNGPVKQAVRKGDLPALKFFHSCGLSMDGRFELVISRNIVGEAAHWGHLEMVQWLHSEAHVDLHAKSFLYTAMGHAAAGGHLGVVQYLHDVAGMKCDVDTMASAARGSQLDILKYFVETVGVDDVMQSKGAGAIAFLASPKALDWLCSDDGGGLDFDWSWDIGHPGNCVTTADNCVYWDYSEEKLTYLHKYGGLVFKTTTLAIWKDSYELVQLVTIGCVR